MDFTRQPIIETVITAKEGFKLVVRSSKGSGQEEYFVDAVEVITFGNSCFFRSTEKPKAFLVPASDYEVLEVREARMVLKNVGFDKTIKIGGGKEASLKALRETEKEKTIESVEEIEESLQPMQARGSQVEKKRDRRKSLRRRRGRDEEPSKEGESSGADLGGETLAESPSTQEMDIEIDQPKIELPEPKKVGKKGRQAAMEMSGSLLKSLLPPPPNLISDTIDKYRQSELFKDVFFKEDKAETSSPETSTESQIPLTQPEYGSFEVSEEEEEKIYQQRKKTHFTQDFEEPFEIFGDKSFSDKAYFEKEESNVNQIESSQESPEEWFEDMQESLGEKEDQDPS